MFINFITPHSLRGKKRSDGANVMDDHGDLLPGERQEWAPGKRKG